MTVKHQALREKDLSSDQAKVYRSVTTWAKSPEGILTLGGYAGCLGGDTQVIYTRGKRAARRTITLRDLYLKFNGQHGSGRGAAQRWARGVETFLESYFPDGRIARNRVLAVFDSGVKETIELRFSDGSSLTATKDHPIAIPSGEFIAAGDLRKGQKVLARGSMKMKPGKGRDLSKRPPRVIVNCKYHPYGARKKVVCNGVPYFYTRVARARLVVEARMNQLPYDGFVDFLKHAEKRAKSLKFLPADVDVHHKDEDTLNDTFENLEVIVAREHARHHGREDGWKHFNREYTRELKIVSIKAAGKRQTYDVQMEAPANNFVANGVVVHNTGKTSILGVFAANTPLLVAYATYTGRAASVLKRKLEACGVAATSGLKPKNEDDDNQRLDSNLSDYFDYDLLDKKAAKSIAYVGTLHRLLYVPVVDANTDEIRGWKKRDKLDRKYDLIVVDEASMVGDDLLADIRRYDVPVLAHDVPVLAVGDHGQLPPVMASGDLMKKPMLKLEKIHRQAESNPIILLSKEIRETGRLTRFLEDGEHIEFVKSASSAIEDAYLGRRPVASVLDVVALCYTNRNRILLNGFARKALSYSAVPKKGEAVICLKNKPPIYNGMRGVLQRNGVIDEETPWILHATVDFEDEGIFGVEEEMCGATFNKERPFESLEEMQTRLPVRRMSEGGWPYDFGYALTVHRAQGSQFEHVVFYVDRSRDPASDEWRRFAYTAVTRSSQKLTVVA